MVAAMAFSCESSLGSAKLRHLGGGGAGCCLSTELRFFRILCQACESIERTQKETNLESRPCHNSAVSNKRSHCWCI
jgi:hypothetical protein